MGVCVSKPEGCAGRRNPPDGSKKRRRRRTIRRRVSSNKVMETIDEVVGPGGADHRSLDPSVQGSIEEAWFETIAVMESDCEEDFESVLDDSLSSNGFEVEAASTRSISSSKDANHEELSAPSSSIDHNQKGLKLREQLIAKAENSLGVDNCGILPNNCLPCLAPTAPPVEKRSHSSSPPNSRKKAPLKLSFKWRSGEGHAIPSPFRRRGGDAVHRSWSLHRAVHRSYLLHRGAKETLILEEEA